MKLTKNHLKYLVAPAVAVLCALIIGLSLWVVQKNKQESIERQLQLKINQEEKVRKEKQEEKRYNQIMYNRCVREAEDEYWAYMELNGTKRDDGSVWAETRYWNRAERQKQQDIENCQKQYLED